MRDSLRNLLFSSFPRYRESRIQRSRRNVLKVLGAGVGALTVPGLLRNASAVSLTEAQAEPNAAQITVLYDAFGKTSTMQKDWGFASYIEYGGKRILFDSGNNAEVFAHNVKARGIDLTQLDFAVISHRHGDHTSGLNHLLRVNPDVPIYAPKENFGVFGAALPGTFYRRNPSLPPEMRYFDGSPPETLYFGSPWPQGNFTWLTETTEVAPGFHLIVLKGSWGVDLDVMEVTLAIDTPDGIVLVVGCSHPTIEKIVETADTTLNKPILLVFGGTHLLPADDEEIARIATSLRDTSKVQWIAPMHCTGEPAFAILKETFGDRYLYAGLGSVLTLGPTVETVAEIGQPQMHALDEDDRRSYQVGLSTASGCCCGGCGAGAHAGGHLHPAFG